MATQVNICNLALRRLGAATITAIDEGSKNADHCSDFWTYILDEVLDDYPWEFAKKTRTLDYTTGFGVYSTTDTKVITGISAASPADVTCTAHGFKTGQTVYITDVSGMTEVNDRVYEITEGLDANSFDLTDIDSTLFTAYTSGGTAIRMEVDPKYALGYTYDLPTDFLKALQLTDPTSEFEILGTLNNRRLCTNVNDAVLTYVSEESTTTNLLNRFISTMAWRLAAELAVPLGKKGAKQDWAMGMYNYVLGKSTVADARNERQNILDSDPWINAGGFTV